MNTSTEARWFRAYQAWKAARNPSFKNYWLSVMQHLRKEFN